MSTLTELMAHQSEIVGRLQELEQEIMDAGGEVTDEQDEEYDRLLDKLLAVEGGVEEKIDGYGAVMTELEQEIEAIRGREKPIKEMKENLLNRRKALERNRSKMKDRLMHYLRQMDEKRVEGQNFRFRRQTNGGKRSINIQDGVHPEDVPERFTKRKFDFTEIRASLKELNTLQQEYERLREEYEEETQKVEDGEDPKAEPEKIAEAAESVLEDLRDLRESVGQFAELEERGEHIRKY